MLQPKLKTCSACGEDKVIWKNHEGEKFCKDCWGKQAPVKHPKRTAISKLPSDKKKPLDLLYSKMRKEFLSKPENSTCFAKLPGCLNSMGENLTIHHTKGRGRYYLDSTTWIPLCITCHQWVEEHPAQAKELNLSQSRF
jgi:hypothetical protein